MRIFEKKFKDQAIFRSTMVFFRKGTVFEIIKFLKEEGIPLLGIDRFRLFDGNFHRGNDGLLYFEGKIQPSMEHSIDFSPPFYTSKTGDIYLDAINFMNEQDESFYFEIVCESSGDTNRS